MRSSSSTADASQRSSAVCNRITNFNIVAGEMTTSISVLSDLHTRSSDTIWAIIRFVV